MRKEKVMDPQMNPEMQKILREPFGKEQVGKLPKITCRDCNTAAAKVCDRHTKAQCNICRNFITGAHMHVDYVGHAAITDRLLKADPDWSWKPAYRNVDPQVLTAACASGNAEVVNLVIANSPPLENVDGMWIALTVGGVIRLGYGTDDRGGMDHDKVLIGDALRNAAMRFGVGLDLWSKEDLGADETSSAPSPAQPAATEEPSAESTRRDWVGEARATTDLDVLLQIGKECSAAGEFVGTTRAALLRRRRELEAAASVGMNGHSSNGR